MINNSNFYENTALMNGGVIFIDQILNLNIISTNFTDNKAPTGDGGALTIQNFNNLELDNCLFSNNLAGQNGGALKLINNKTTSYLHINNTIF